MRRVTRIAEVVEPLDHRAPLIERRGVAINDIFTKWADSVVVFKAVRAAQKDEECMAVFDPV